MNARLGLLGAALLVAHTEPIQPGFGMGQSRRAKQRRMCRELDRRIAMRQIEKPAPPPFHWNRERRRLLKNDPQKFYQQFPGAPGAPKVEPVKLIEADFAELELKVAAELSRPKVPAKKSVRRKAKIKAGKAKPKRLAFKEEAEPKPVKGKKVVKNR